MYLIMCLENNKILKKFIKKQFLLCWQISFKVIIQQYSHMVKLELVKLTHYLGRNLEKWMMNYKLTLIILMGLYFK